MMTMVSMVFHGQGWLIMNYHERQRLTMILTMVNLEFDHGKPFPQLFTMVNQYLTIVYHGQIELIMVDRDQPTMTMVIKELTMVDHSKKNAGSYLTMVNQ